MEERKGLVTIKGNPLTLVGPELKPGMPAPDVELLDNDLKPVRLSAFRGKVVVISAVRPWTPRSATWRPGASTPRRPLWATGWSS